MDDEPRIVVSFDDVTTPDDRIVVAVDPEPPPGGEPPAAQDRLLVELSPRDLPSDSRRQRRRGWAVAVIALLVVAVGGSVAWSVLDIGSTVPDAHAVALPTDPSGVAKTVASLEGGDSALIRFVADANTLSGLHSAATCRAYAASTLQPLGGPATLLSAVESLPSQAVRDALTNVLDATATQLLRCESGQATDASSTGLQFAEVVAQRLLKQAGLAVALHGSATP